MQGAAMTSAPSARRPFTRLSFRSSGRVTASVFPWSSSAVHQSSVSLSAQTCPTTISAGLRTPAFRTASASAPTVETTLRCVPRAPFSMTAAGMSSGSPAAARPSVTCRSAVSPMRNTSVPPVRTSASKSIASGLPTRACAVTMCTDEQKSRCVTGIPANAGTASALVTPGSTRNGTPCAFRYSHSSPPRPNR